MMIHPRFFNPEEVVGKRVVIVLGISVWAAPVSVVFFLYLWEGPTSRRARWRAPSLDLHGVHVATAGTCWYHIISSTIITIELSQLENPQASEGMLLCVGLACAFGGFFLRTKGDENGQASKREGEEEELSALNLVEAQHPRKTRAFGDPVVSSSNSTCSVQIEILTQLRFRHLRVRPWASEW